MSTGPLASNLTALLMCAALTPIVAAQSVTVITNGTGGALQAAINAAADGDTLLLHGGNYSACVVDGKALRIVAEPTNGTTVESLHIANLPAGKLLTLAGLKVWATLQLSTPPPAIRFQSCAGSVRIDQIDSTGVAPSRSGLAAYGCFDLAVANTSSRGGPGIGAAYATGRGLETGNSHLALYDSTLDGGNGANAVYSPPFMNVSSVPGGHGLVAYSPGYPSQIFVSGLTARGGSGGNGSVQTISGGCVGYSGANGGTGILGLDGTVYIRDTAASGGAGGALFVTCPSHGPGQPGTGTSGNVMQSAALRLGLRSSPAVREKQPIPITVTGTPGEIVALHIGQRPEFTPDATGSNVRLVADPVRRVVLGVVPPSGVLVSTIGGIPLPPVYATATYLMQVVAVEATGALRYGASVPLVVLDSAY